MKLGVELYLSQDYTISNFTFSNVTMMIWFFRNVVNNDWHRKCYDVIR